MLEFRAYPESCYPCPTYEDLPHTRKQCLRYHQNLRMVPTNCPWCGGSFHKSEKKFGTRLICYNKAEHAKNGHDKKIFYHEGRPDWMSGLLIEPWELQRMLWLRLRKVSLNVICDVIPSFQHLDAETRCNRITIFNERFRNLD